MKVFLLLLAIVGLILVDCKDPDEGLTVPDLIKSRNYNYETHWVTTSDGYILAVHRIVNPKFLGQKLKPVILQHGLLSSGSDFIINSPGGAPDEDIKVVGNNLGFELAKRGYDVWLANSRGNCYSINHTTLDLNSREFWEFSYDEMAEFDLPATIDHVLAVSGSPTTGYVGHSQGTAIMFALLSTQPKYNDLIKPYVALAPITSVAFATAPLRLFAYSDSLVEFFTWKGGSFLPDKLISYFGEKFCALAPPVMVNVCENAIFLMMGGFDSPQLNTTRFPVYVSLEPAGTSSQNMIHWVQAIKTGRFAKFDHGIIGNLRAYGDVFPPSYPLEKITNKYIVLMNGLNDGMSTSLDVMLMKKQLKVPLMSDYIVPDKLFNHLDFVWAKDAGKYVNSMVLKALDSVN